MTNRIETPQSHFTAATYVLENNLTGITAPTVAADAVEKPDEWKIKTSEIAPVTVDNKTK